MCDQSHVSCPLPRDACTWESIEGHEPRAWDRQPMVVQRADLRCSMQPCLPEAQQPWGGPREKLMVKCALWRLAFPAWRLEEAGGARSTLRANRADSVLGS